MLATLILAATNAAEKVTNADLMNQLEELGGYLVAILILVALVGVVLAWSQRRIANNQIEVADLLRKSLRILEKDIEKKD